MEILFIFISLLLSISFCYAISRLVASHSELMRLYRKSDDLLGIHLFLTLMLALIVFVTLCAFNNSIWHLPYYFK